MNNSSCFIFIFLFFSFRDVNGSGLDLRTRRVLKPLVLVRVLEAKALLPRAAATARFLCLVRRLTSSASPHPSSSSESSKSLLSSWKIFYPKKKRGIAPS
ncbi:hypothetical protein ACMD2_23635 [Ananas comosus]|uniref:Secreted protein n=1 Tax=Ananas comosus TaxID=4615 RepID=A0A199UNV0_ANACO|nr:hypothetical protein ACMD2_23635 [Ananas comosus]